MKTDIYQIIDKVIECSRRQVYADLDNIFPSRDYYRSFLAQLHTQIKDENDGKFLHGFDALYRLADKYHIDSLSHIIKGLTMVENNLKLHDSVSPVIPLYSSFLKKSGHPYHNTGSKDGVYWFLSSLEEHPNQKIVGLTNWILNHAENIYVPFGISTVNSRTLVGMESEIKTWDEYTKLRERQEREDKEKRDDVRKELKAKNIQKHRTKTKVDSEYRLSLETLSTSELLSQIIKDEKRAIYFYSDELSSIASIEPEYMPLLKKVILRFKEKESRHFRTLKTQLNKMVD